MKRVISSIAFASILIVAGAAEGHGGWNVGFGFYFGGPGWWGGTPYAYPGPYAYPYPAYYPYAGPYPYAGYYTYPGYAYPRYAPYPVYAPPRPVYIQRPPAVVNYSPPARPAQRIERYTLSAQELFAFDSDELRTPQPKLDEIAAAMKSNPQISKVAINGYTDRIGTDEYNLDLSQRRADAVKAYLVGKGVAADRLVATGKGKANAIVRCENSNREALIHCLEPNRRVEVEQITITRRVTEASAR